MICVTIRCREDELEAALALAAFADLAGVQELPGQVLLTVTSEAEAAELCQRLSAWQPVPTTVDESRNWNEAWQSTWTPILVGERFYLVPPHDNSPTPPGRLRLAMHAGMAFGNGDHATTHLCLMAMERALRPGDIFLDVGCGSGLLGEAARALGTNAALGCDLDQSAVRPGNAFIGSVEAVRRASCDFVVANIQLGVLLELLPELAQVVKPGGHLALSGILSEQLEELGAQATEAGLLPVSTASSDGWSLLLLIRTEAAAQTAPAAPGTSTGSAQTQPSND